MSIDLELMNEILQLRETGLTYKAIQNKLHIRSNKIAFAIRNKDAILKRKANDINKEKKRIIKELEIKTKRIAKKRKYRNFKRKFRKILLKDRYKYIMRLDNFADDIKDFYDITKLKAIKTTLRLIKLPFSAYADLDYRVVLLLNKHGYYTDEFSGYIYNGGFMFEGVKEITLHKALGKTYKVNRKMLVQYADNTKDLRGYGFYQNIESIILHLFYTKAYPLNHMTKWMILRSIRKGLLIEK